MPRLAGNKVLGRTRIADVDRVLGGIQKGGAQRAVQRVAERPTDLDLRPDTHIVKQPIGAAIIAGLGIGVPERRLDFEMLGQRDVEQGAIRGKTDELAEQRIVVHRHIEELVMRVIGEAVLVEEIGRVDATRDDGDVARQGL
jgi:hypothetical protein